MTNSIFFSALGEPTLGLTAAIQLLNAYERYLSETHLSIKYLASETFSNLVVSEYVTQCLNKELVTPESLLESKEIWGQKNFDKYPDLRIEAIKTVFARFCSDKEICPPLKTKETTSPPTSPSFTTKTFLKPASQPPSPIDRLTSTNHQRSQTTTGFKAALLQHLATKNRTPLLP